MAKKKIVNKKAVERAAAAKAAAKTQADWDKKNPGKSYKPVGLLDMPGDDPAPPDMNGNPATTVNDAVPRSEDTVSVPAMVPSASMPGQASTEFIRKPKDWEPHYMHVRMADFLYVEVEPDGDNWSVTVGFATEEDANAFASAVEANIDDPEIIDPVTGKPVEEESDDLKLAHADDGKPKDEPKPKVKA